MFDKTVTIYNYQKIDKVEKWQRTVLDGVSIHYSIEKAVGENGIVKRTQILTVVIPEDVAADGRRYIDHRQYAKLKDTSRYWTINPSDNLDVIVADYCRQEITDEYRVKDLKADFTKCGTICGFQDNTDEMFLKHYEVVCK